MPTGDAVLPDADRSTHTRPTTLRHRAFGEDTGLLSRRQGLPHARSAPLPIAVGGWLSARATTGGRMLRYAPNDVRGQVRPITRCCGSTSRSRKKVSAHRSTKHLTNSENKLWISEHSLASGFRSCSKIFAAELSISCYCTDVCRRGLYGSTVGSGTIAGQHWAIVAGMRRSHSTITS